MEDGASADSPEQDLLMGKVIIKGSKGMPIWMRLKNNPLELLDKVHPPIVSKTPGIHDAVTSILRSFGRAILNPQAGKKTNWK